MTKLCARGKAAAKRKFAVYPSAYANAYASKICAGKIKDPSGKKRKDWGPKKAKEGKYVDMDAVRKITRKLKSLKKDIYPKKKPKFQREKDLPYAMTIDTTTSRYGNAGKGRKVPEMSKGGMADYYKDLM